MSLNGSLPRAGSNDGSPERADEDPVAFACHLATIVAPLYF